MGRNSIAVTAVLFCALAAVVPHCNRTDNCGSATAFPTALPLSIVTSAVVPPRSRALLVVPAATTWPEDPAPDNEWDVPGNDDSDTGRWCRRRRRPVMTMRRRSQRRPWDHTRQYWGRSSIHGRDSRLFMTYGDNDLMHSVASHVPEAMAWAFCAVCFGQTKHSKEETPPLDNRKATLERDVDSKRAAVCGGERGEMDTDDNTVQRPLTVLEFIQAITIVVDDDKADNNDATPLHVVAPTTTTPSVPYIPLRIPASASATEAADVLMRRFRGTATGTTTAPRRWIELNNDNFAPIDGTTISSEGHQEDSWQTTVVSSPMEFQQLDPPKPRTIQSFYPYQNPTTSSSTDRIQGNELTVWNGEMAPESQHFESSALYEQSSSELDLDSPVTPALLDAMAATPLSILDEYTERPWESSARDALPAESQYWSVNDAPLLEKDLRANLSYLESYTTTRSSSDFLDSVVRNGLQENDSFGPEQLAAAADFGLPLMPLYSEDQYSAVPTTATPSYSERSSHWPAVSPTSRAMSATPSESREAVSPALRAKSPWMVHWDDAGDDATPSTSTQAPSPPPRATSQWKVHWDGAESRATTPSTDWHHYCDTVQSVAEDSNTWQSGAADSESVTWESSPPPPPPIPPHKPTWGVSSAWNGNSNPLGSSYLSQISQPAAGEVQIDTLHSFSYGARAARVMEQGEEQVSTASTPRASWASQPSRHDAIAPASPWTTNGNGFSAPSMQSDGFHEPYQDSSSRTIGDQYSTTSAPFASWKATPSRNDNIAPASFWSDTGTGFSVPSAQGRGSHESYLDTTAVTTGEQFETASTTPLASWAAPSSGHDTIASASIWSDNGDGFSVPSVQSRGSHGSYLESTSRMVGDSSSLPASTGTNSLPWSKTNSLRTAPIGHRPTAAFDPPLSSGNSFSWDRNGILATAERQPREGAFSNSYRTPTNRSARDAISRSSWDSSSWSANRNGLSTSSIQNRASYPEPMFVSDDDGASTEAPSSLPELPAQMAFAAESVAEMAPADFSDEIYSEPNFLWAMDTPRQAGSGMASSSSLSSTFYQSTSSVGSLSNGPNQETILRIRLPPTESPSATQTPSQPESSWQPSSENFSWALDSSVRRHGAPDVSQSYYNYGAAMQENSRPVIGRLGQTVIGRLGEVSEDREWWSKTSSTEWNKARW
jgi:hypothetical protein